MTQILDLITFTPADERVGLELLAKNRDACIADYKMLTREIPNLHAFFSAVRTTYTDETIPRIIWFRLWCVIKAEEEIGLNITLSMLRIMPHIDDREIELRRNPGPKIITHCFKVLHGLISSARGF